MKTTLLHLAGALTALLLAACATPPANTNATQVGAYQDTLDLSGRLSVNYQKDEQPAVLTGKFTWTQKPGRIDVALLSPLDQTVAMITVTPQSATLVQSDKQPRVARDINTLTAETLGWPLPVDGLRDWLQGYAKSADGQHFAASPARNKVTTADGWNLTFVDWDESGARPQPRRIVADRKASAVSGELSIRIVVDPRG
jgi:outer membrane lipoprotein LolB